MAKTKTTPTPAPEAPRENRYLRAARVIIEAGEGIELAELAMKAEMSQATAGFCLEAFKGVCTALRDNKLLPARKAPAQPEPQPESVPAK